VPCRSELPAPSGQMAATRRQREGQAKAEAGEEPATPRRRGDSTAGADGATKRTPNSKPSARKSRRKSRAEVEASAEGSEDDRDIALRPREVSAPSKPDKLPGTGGKGGDREAASSPSDSDNVAARGRSSKQSASESGKRAVDSEEGLAAGEDLGTSEHEGGDNEEENDQALESGDEARALESDAEESAEGRAKKKSKKKKDKPGVVYINRPPLFMKPMKIKFLLSQLGEVNKLYLEPEPDTTRISRKKRGGSSKIKYREGWIEFADRKVAKLVALSLNGKPVGGDRRSFHYEDLWTLKYLPGFKWTHLTEKAAYERRTQAVRLQAELAAAKRENEEYLENVAKSKKLNAIISNKIRRQKAESSKSGEESGAAGALQARKRSFKQQDHRSSYQHNHVSKKAKEGQWLDDVFT